MKTFSQATFKNSNGDSMVVYATIRGQSMVGVSLALHRAMNRLAGGDYIDGLARSVSDVKEVLKPLYSETVTIYKGQFYNGSLKMTNLDSGLSLLFTFKKGQIINIKEV